MTRLAAILLALALAGCTTATVTLQPDPESESILTIEPKFYGRGCASVSVATDSDGSQVIDILVASDAVTDWSLGRVLSFIGDIAGGVFGGNRTMTEPQGPDSKQGCDQLFESATEEEAEETVVVRGQLVN